MLKKILASIICILGTPLNAMFPRGSNQISRAKYNSEQVKFLVGHVQNFLKDNQHQLACQQNESGFIRFNIPAPESYKQKYEKMRLNFWPSKSESFIDPETIHSHPRAFDSIVLSGGYVHGLYEENKEKETPIFDRYRIFKPTLDVKKMMFIGHVQVKHLEDKAVEKGALIHIPTLAIHRILKTLPLTLSLNMVERTCKDQEYDVYLTPGSSLLNIKTKRNFIAEDQTIEIAQDAISVMEVFNKNI